MEHLLTVNEAAELLGVSNEAVRRLCLRGSLEYVRIGGRRLIRRDEVQRRIKRLAREGVKR